MSNSAYASPPTPHAALDTVPWHVSVLGREVTEFLRPSPGRTYLDGTLGGGGHSEALLAAGSRVVGVDRDPEAIHRASDRLSPFGEAFRAVHADFSSACARPEVTSWTPFDGAVLDLGVSSRQLDCASRGFSFQADGPLDMRMDRSEPSETAADLVNTLPEGDLARLFRDFGGEPQAKRAARAVAAERSRAPFTHTARLAALMEKVLGRRGRTHPATRVFQALRIAVNRELELLEAGLRSIPPLLRAGARFVVITFHSLEDGMVKRTFRAGAQRWLDRPEWPAPRLNPAWRFRDLTRHPVEPSPAEVAANPRARSARLRAVEILDPREVQP